MNLTSIKTIKELLARHGFAFSKSLGQNFLINPSVCLKIASEGRDVIDYAPCVFEIGAGIGVLTKELSRTCKKVVCVEIDRALEPILAETLADCSNVEIVWGDVMKIDLAELFAQKFEGEEEIICCANLPYYITSPVIMRLLEERLPLKTITVMVQKEAALRLCSPVGSRDCGAVSVAVRYYSEPKKLFNVSRGSFIPAPSVDSAVIRLKVHGGERYRGDVSDERLFFRIVRAAFSQRRKQLANPVSEELNLPKERIKAALSACDLNTSARAEDLTLEEFIKLYNNINRENI
ncbi:MAG: 16S rRNA (adenine(1518)-N(6)/adenine(1519)-N(6))-dimethyltransferase RsmA [Oscillospiraceae bacterium]|nr:16S rRNA (adenine(1518)-N(6)/adenine(1519)-N(6))-dimethyltransferase RsmA [Oscillospiraceae bacterium]